MNLKHAILSCMRREELKRAVDDLGLDGVDRRSVEDMAARLSRMHRATPEALLGYLSEAQVKDVCEQIGVSARGRRGTLVAHLLDGVKERPENTRRRQAERVVPVSRQSGDGERLEKNDAETRWSKPSEVRMNDLGTATVSAPPKPEAEPGFRVTRTELVWPGKYDEHGNLNEPRRVSLPFQVIEVIEEGRTSKEALLPRDCSRSSERSHEVLLKMAGGAS